MVILIVLLRHPVNEETPLGVIVTDYLLIDGIDNELFIWMTLSYNSIIIPTLLLLFITRYDDLRNSLVVNITGF